MIFFRTTKFSKTLDGAPTSDAWPSWHENIQCRHIEVFKLPSSVAKPNGINMVGWGSTKGITINSLEGGAQRVSLGVYVCPQFFFSGTPPLLSS